MKLNRFGLIFINCLLVTSLLFSGTAYAQDEELPDPGITPDSPFYFFDIWSKNIGLFFAFGPEAKVHKALKYAEERLAEAQVMAVKNKVKEIKQATSSYNEFVALVSEKTEEASQQGAPDNMSEIVALATGKHLSILDKVKDAVPEEAKEAVIQAKEASTDGQKNALRILAMVKPERAIEINLATIEIRLNRARVKAEENNTEDVEEALNDSDKLFEFGQEISEIAQGQGKDITPVEKLIAQATRNYLEVMATLYEKVPEHAKPAIEGAIANSLINHERIIAALEEKDALGELPEQVLLPEKIQASITQRIAELKPQILEYEGLEDEEAIHRTAQELQEVSVDLTTIMPHLQSIEEVFRLLGVLEKAVVLHEKGLSWAHVARELGYGADGMHLRLQDIAEERLRVAIQSGAISQEQAEELFAHFDHLALEWVEKIYADITEITPEEPEKVALATILPHLGSIEDVFRVLGVWEKAVLLHEKGLSWAHVARELGYGADGMHLRLQDIAEKYLAVAERSGSITADQAEELFAHFDRLALEWVEKIYADITEITPEEPVDLATILPHLGSIEDVFRVLGLWEDAVVLHEKGLSWAHVARELGYGADSMHLRLQDIAEKHLAAAEQSGSITPDQAEELFAQFDRLALEWVKKIYADAL